MIGTVGGRRGSFVLQHEGAFEAETVTASWRVVSGSGAGDLRGLSGEGGFTAKHGQPETPYTLDYQIE